MLRWSWLSHKETRVCSIDVIQEEMGFVGQIATHVILFNPYNDAEVGHPPHFMDEETEAWRGYK